MTVETSREDAGVALRVRGLGYLAEGWMLDLEETGPVPVRLVEVSAERIVVKEEDFGDVFHETALHVLPFPAPEALQPRHR